MLFRSARTDHVLGTFFIFSTESAESGVVSELEVPRSPEVRLGAGFVTRTADLHQPPPPNSLACLPNPQSIRCGLLSFCDVGSLSLSLLSIDSSPNLSSTPSTHLHPSKCPLTSSSLPEVSLRSATVPELLSELSLLDLTLSSTAATGFLGTQVSLKSTLVLCLLPERALESWAPSTDRKSVV